MSAARFGLGLLLACSAGAPSAKPGATPGLGSVDESAPGVTVRGLTLSGPPSESAAAALAASAEPAPPLPKCDASPVASKPGPQPELVIQDGHTAMILDLEISDDGTVLVSAGMDGIVRVWDTHRGLLLRRLAGGGGTLNVALTGAANVLAVYSPIDAYTKIDAYRLQTGAPPKAIRGAATGYNFELSRDGSLLATVAREVGFFNTKTGKQTGRIGLPGDSQAVALSPKGDRLAVAVGASVVIADVKRKKIVRTWTRPDHAQIGNNAFKLALTTGTVLVKTIIGDVFAYPINGGKGRKLATDAGDLAVVGESVWVLRKGAKPTLERLSIASGKVETSLSPSLFGGLVNQLAASADGSTLALAGQSLSGRKNVIKIVDATSGTVLRTLEGQESAVRSIAVTPDFGQLATGSNAGLARWDLSHAQLTGLIPGENAYVAFGPKAGYVVSAASMWAEQRDAKTGALMRRWLARSVGALLPGTHVYLGALDGKLKRWDIAPVKPVPAPEPVWEPAQPPTGKDVGALPWDVFGMSAAGDAVAINGWNRGDATKAAVGVMDLASGKLRWSDEFAVTTIRDVFVALDPKARRLFVSSHDRVKKGKGVAFRFSLRVYDAKTGKLQRRQEMSTRGPMAFLGETLAVGGRKPVLLDARSLKVRAKVSLPDTDATAVTAHAARKVFLFGGDSGVTSIVASTSARVHAMLLSTPDGEHVAATPEGRFKASLDGARRVGWTFHRPVEGFTFDQFGTLMNKPAAVVDAVALRGAGSGSIVARPPRVSLGDVPPAVDGDTASVTIRAEAERWVERVRVYANGRPVSDALVCAKKKTIKVDVPLSPGRNRISVVAYDASGYASNAAQADVSSKHGGERPDLWVVTAGVSSYPKLPKHLQLAFADDDATSIADSLGGLVGKGKPFGELKQVTLLNESVTPANLERSLAVLAEMKADDLAVVFLAGHGVRLRDGKMVFLTSGASLQESAARKASVGWDRIQAVLRAARGRTILMLDACHSGHLSTELIAPNEDLAAELAADNRAGVLVFAASRGSQFSYEVGAGGGGSRGLELAWQGAPRVAKQPAQGHGLFTSAVLEALAGEAIDRDRSGAVELGEFIDYVTERVRAASNGKQTPWVVRREMFGDYAIVGAPGN